jgi:hypothetical protein
MPRVFPFLREKVREGTIAARKRFHAKRAEDEGVAHGATPDPDFDGEYRQLNLNDAIDRAFEANRQYGEDPSAMTQPGVLHGALNQINRAGVASPELVAPPLVISPTTSGGSGN